MGGSLGKVCGGTVQTPMYKPGKGEVLSLPFKSLTDKTSEKCFKAREGKTDQKTEPRCLPFPCLK